MNIYIYVIKILYKYIYIPMFQILLFILGHQNLPSWGPKSTKLGLNIHQVGVQNPPSWDPKSRKISLGRILEGSWSHLGPSWPPRPAQDQNIPPKPISGGPLGHPFWKPKTSQNQFFRVPRGVNFLSYFLIGPRSIFLGFQVQLATQNPPKIEPRLVPRGIPRANCPNH